MINSIKVSILIMLLSASGVFARHINVIPQPQSVEKGEGEFTLNSKTEIIADKLNQSNAAYLQDILKNL
ncbi:MAG: glycoside hydrolase family 20 zincin-like fold domain-containing protein, partial [Carboxylicivirga sp.]|nr:glycoside hydrolase family 20 zincin-like fold domain-containing protein [Carboxylicivirga sp.]